MIRYKTADEIERMALAGELVARAFLAIEPLVVEGTTTGEIDVAIRDFVLGAGGKLLFLDYRGFPAHSCISVNEEVVHGIPGPRRLLDGDLVSIDIGVRHDGYCGDSARTFCVGAAAPRAVAIRRCCQEALEAGIAAAVPGGPLSAVSRAIQDVIVGAGFHVVRRYVGHGIGREMHEEPQVPNFVGLEARVEEIELRPGLVVAIEPMVNEGTAEVRTLEDGWTVVTGDGGLSAHCEHTVAIMESGPRILTRIPLEVGTDRAGPGGGQAGGSGAGSRPDTDP